MIRAFSLFVAGLAAVGCAPTTGPDATPGGSARAERRCFNVDQVQNYRQTTATQVNVRALGGDVYQLDAAGGCWDLDSAVRLAILPDGAGLAGGRACVGDLVRLAVPGAPTDGGTCRARVTKRLTDAEIAALPSRQRP